MSGRQRSNSRLEADAMALTEDLIARLGQCPPEPGWSPADQKFEDEDYRQMLQALMTARPADQLWLFAYGSLMWRPACPIANAGPPGSGLSRASACGCAAIAARPSGPG